MRYNIPENKEQQKAIVDELFEDMAMNLDDDLRDSFDDLLDAYNSEDSFDEKLYDQLYDIYKDRGTKKTKEKLFPGVHDHATFLKDLNNLWKSLNAEQVFGFFQDHLTVEQDQLLKTCSQLTESGKMSWEQSNLAMQMLGNMEQPGEQHGNDFFAEIDMVEKLIGNRQAVREICEDLRTGALRPETYVASRKALLTKFAESDVKDPSSLLPLYELSASNAVKNSSEEKIEKAEPAEKEEPQLEEADMQTPGNGTEAETPGREAVEEPMKNEPEEPAPAAQEPEAPAQAAPANEENPQAAPVEDAIPAAPIEEAPPVNEENPQAAPVEDAIPAAPVEDAPPVNEENPQAAPVENAVEHAEPNHAPIVRNMQEISATRDQIAETLQAVGDLSKSHWFSRDKKGIENFRKVAEAVQAYVNDHADVKKAHTAYEACRNYMADNLKKDGKGMKSGTKDHNVRNQTVVHLLELMEKLPEFEGLSDREAKKAPKGLDGWEEITHDDLKHGAKYQKLNFKELEASLAKHSSDTKKTKNKSKAFSDLNKRIEKKKKAEQMPKNKKGNPKAK